MTDAASTAGKTVLAFGETLWDILPSETLLGGAPFNFAYRVNSLGDRALIASSLGLDQLGEEAWNRIVALGMDIELLQRDASHPTGTVNIAFDAARNPLIVINPSAAYDHIQPLPKLVSRAQEADCICFGTVAQRARTSRDTLHIVLDATQGIRLFDVNLRKDCYSIENIARSLERTDIVKLNEEEARALGLMFDLPVSGLDEFTDAMLSRWPMTCCVVTLGECGVFARDRDEGPTYVAGYRVSLVDPLGSGDAFTAGFLNRRLRGAPLAEACRFGNILGALVAEQSGATGALSAESIALFEERHPARCVAPDMAIE